MQDAQEMLNIAATAQVNFMIITAIAVGVGVATAAKSPKMERKGYIIGCLLACLLMIPAFLILKPLLAPGLDFSDPNPGKAAMIEASRLMGFASIPAAVIIGRFTAYRNRDVGHSDRKAYLAAIPVVGSIWMLTLLFKTSDSARA